MLPSLLSSVVPLLTGCNGSDVEPLSPVEHLNRASLAVRGVRPSVNEVRAVQDDPDVLPDLVDGWLDTPAFGETVKDLHAQLFLLRADTNYQLPVKGLLEERGYSQADVHYSTVEAPLELVREVVMEDRPYTDVLTADYTVANEVVAAIYGLPFDPSGPEWQHTDWTDGRPQSGLLSDSEMWRRHVSNAANFHRGRAAFVSSTFLCEDISARDVFVEDVNVADPLEVADVVNRRTSCQACHSALDPLAAFFWGYKEQLQRGAILSAYSRGCEWDWSEGPPPSAPPRDAYRIEHWCYPLKFYDVAEEGAWADWNLSPPGYWGESAHDMLDLGDLLASDPRFHECTARNVAAYLTQGGRDELPFPWVQQLTGALVDSGFSFRELVREVVLSEEFATARAKGATDRYVPGLQTIRPEQLSRTLEDLTGFVWEANQDHQDCAFGPGSNVCWGSVDLLNNDLFGVRSMMGGIDGYTVTHPIHTPTPTQQLALRIVAQEAAGYVVPRDFAKSPADRRLLRSIEPSQTDEDAVRNQIAELYLRILGQDVSPRSEQVDLAYELWKTASRGSSEDGWKVVITALLRDPAMVLY